MKSSAPILPSTQRQAGPSWSGTLLEAIQPRRQAALCAVRKLLQSPATAARPVTPHAQLRSTSAKAQCRCAQRVIPPCRRSSRAETSNVQAPRHAASIRAARAFSKASPLMLVSHQAPPPHPRPSRRRADTQSAHLQRLRGKQHVGVWTGVQRSSKHPSSVEMACAAASLLIIVTRARHSCAPQEADTPRLRPPHLCELVAAQHTIAHCHDSTIDPAT